MKYTCPLCSIDPLSHSLSQVCKKGNIIYYYTCPSKAKMYFDTIGIINHYDGELSEIPENTKWIWKSSDKLKNLNNSGPTRNLRQILFSKI